MSGERRGASGQNCKDLTVKVRRVRDKTGSGSPPIAHCSLFKSSCLITPSKRENYIDNDIDTPQYLELEMLSAQDAGGICVKLAQSKRCSRENRPGGK